MEYLIATTLLGLALWIGLSFYWTRLALATLAILGLAACLAALTWLTLNGFLSTAWNWCYALILPPIGLGLYMLWTAYWVVLTRCLEWFARQRRNRR